MNCYTKRGPRPLTRLFVGAVCVLIAVTLTFGGLIAGSVFGGLFEWFAGGMFWYMAYLKIKKYNQEKATT